MKISGFQFGALAVILGGVVLLTLFQRPTGSYIALVTPILAALYLDAKTEKQNRVLDEQTQQLQQITHQTNGVLTERINTAVAEGVKAALAEREGSGTE
ncbi:hypothetical protein ABZY09_30540 [Streptomyces sp. NPDC002928]|uniref:hypothetical protein n=1 Tax=Streptomyces sp. NPDC002928 TaxID=3154440 RepID=UPI0033B193EB